MATVRYMVSDVERAIGFYTGTLGFKLEFKAPPIAKVARKDLTLLLAGPHSSAGRSMPDGAEPEPGGWNRILLEVDDLVADVAKLRKQGQRFRNDIVTGPGGKQILLQDPDDNLVELFEPARDSKKDS